MNTQYVLVDYENVQVKSLALLKGENFRVRVFLGPKNSKLPRELVIAMHQFGKHAEYTVLEAPGSNALDFHIAYYLGVLAAADPSGFFHIISKDTGFDPLIQHLRREKISSARSSSIEEMPCFNQNVTSTTVENKVLDKKKPGSPPAGHFSVDGMIKVAVDDLVKRKAAKPRTMKTLRNTIQAKCGKAFPPAEVDAVLEALIERGYVKIDGTKVTYALPGT